MLLGPWSPTTPFGSDADQLSSLSAADAQVHVYRRFFVNMTAPDDTAINKRVNRALPRAQPCLYLYEFLIPEDQFQVRADPIHTLGSGMERLAGRGLITVAWPVVEPAQAHVVLHPPGCRRGL